MSGWLAGSELPGLRYLQRCDEEKEDEGGRRNSNFCESVLYADLPPIEEAGDVMAAINYQ